ncbi:elongation factor P [Breznakia pachnodae]|jgi:elongation factor P|uniref:Elongation factor P n=1 Tax=Breznakia pachnodae TaxID=265178 RepID=A0ABU0E7F2_9FIRM|nr:elongation factor P [Breznakia pachnodae]MDQ0362829.1 elongation factor P [Breznakia pachnodae]
MLQSNELKPGITFQHEGNIYVVLDYSHNKTARSATTIKAKVRNLRTGANVELSFGSGDKIQPAHIDKKEMQYLYDAGEALMFMDNDTYEQVEVPKQNIEWEMNFLKENDNVTLTTFEGEILGLVLPDKVALQIVESEPAVKGDTATNAQKNAVLETGFTVRVPLFIGQDEVILVSTADGKYSGRA